MGWKEDSVASDTLSPSLRRRWGIFVRCAVALFFSFVALNAGYKFLSAYDNSEEYFNSTPGVMELFDSLVLLQMDGGTGRHAFAPDFNASKRISRLRKKEESARHKFLDGASYIDRDGIQSCVLLRSKALLDYFDFAEDLMERVSFSETDLNRYKEKTLLVIEYTRECKTKIAIHRIL